MKLGKIVSWLDATLNVAAFDDVANTGLQIGRAEEAEAEVKTVAFAVDASVRAVKAAAAAGAGLLVVHHGISWGGGIRRLAGGVYGVVKTAMDTNVAIYACHLPLDAHPKLGNNAHLAKELGLKHLKPAFSYHGNVIGLVGDLARPCELAAIAALDDLTLPVRVGVCSGGAGEFAEEAKNLGCDLYVTGEASWGDVIAAENCGMTMACLGHYETEVWGVRAVSVEMRKTLRVKTIDLTEELRRADP